MPQFVLASSPSSSSQAIRQFGSLDWAADGIPTRLRQDIGVFGPGMEGLRSDRAGSHGTVFSVQLTLISAFLLLANIIQQVKTLLLPLSNTESLLTPSDIRDVCRRRQAPGS